MKILIPLLAIAAACVIVVPFLDHGPVWDGVYYFRRCLIPAIQAPFDIRLFACFSHPSIVYMLLLGIPQYIFHGNTFALNVTNVVLFSFSIWAFWKILQYVLPDKMYRNERFFGTFLYAVFPPFLANVVNLNVDTGAAIFSVLTIYAFTLRRPWWVMIFGLVMVFTKEPAIAQYFVFLLGFWWYYDRRITSAKDKYSVRQYIFLIMPLLVLGGYIVIRRSMGEPYLWFNFGPRTLLSHIYLVLSLWKQLVSVLSGMLITNWTWILTIIGLASGARSFFVQKASDTKVYVFMRLITSSTIATIVILASFLTYTNIRYYLILYPLLILLATIGISVYIHAKQIRQGIFLGVCFLFVAANWYTFDPISLRLFGTFPFGKHRLLHMTSISGECCGFGRDQLTYNLQYQAFFVLKQMMYRDLKPDQTTIFISASSEAHADIEDFLNLDTHDFSVADISRSGIRAYNVVDSTAASQLRTPWFYVAYPNGVDDKEALRTTVGATFGATRRYMWRGYELSVTDVYPADNTAQTERDMIP